MIEVRKLVKDYGPRRALHGINFSVPAGAVVGFLGPNGSGKTTMLNALERNGGRYGLQTIRWYPYL